MTERPVKPLGQKAYGSIPHLLGSRRGPADMGANEGQHRICTEQTRDRHDTIIVQEKLDGGCVSVAKIGGVIHALGRAGFPANTSPFQQHHMFHDWVMTGAERDRFDLLLRDGERVVGEWLAQAHGTRYRLHHMPFVAFDIMRGTERTPWAEVQARCARLDLPTPRLIHHSPLPCSIEVALKAIRVSGHGAIDQVEGAVWRVERQGRVDFLAKYVVAGKVDGCYLPEISGCAEVWNWQPDMASAA